MARGEDTGISSEIVLMMETNKIYNENCMDTMRRMPDGFVDLTVTSPTYDNLRDYKGYSFPFEEIAKELYRITKKGGILVWVVGDSVIDGSETLTAFKQALHFKEIGFNIHDTMIYSKTFLPQNGKRYNQSFEYMFVCSKGKPNTFNPIKRPYSEKTLQRRKTKYTFNKHRDVENDGREIKEFGLKNDGVTKENVWHYTVGNMQSSKDKIAFEHPAIFPEQLANDHIISWSNEGDLVYDCFMGSGTTAKMSILNNRNWIGSEISEEYVKIAEKRLRPHLMQVKLKLF